MHKFVVGEHALLLYSLAQEVFTLFESVVSLEPLCYASKQFETSERIHIPAPLLKFYYVLSPPVTLIVSSCSHT